MKKDTSIHEMITRTERVSRFFAMLKSIGFKVRINQFYFEGRDYHYIKHSLLPHISSLFSVDEIKMDITSCTVDTASWVMPVNKDESLMSCQNFIIYMKRLIKADIDKMNDKLDAVVL